MIQENLYQTELDNVILLEIEENITGNVQFGISASGHLARDYDASNSEGLS